MILSRRCTFLTLSLLICVLWKPPVGAQAKLTAAHWQQVASGSATTPDATLAELQEQVQRKLRVWVGLSTIRRGVEQLGEHLWRVATLEVTEAALGTSLVVPTLDGDTSVRVPPGTQPDSILRLKGKGLPRFGDRGWGDLLLRVQVHVPERLLGEERKLYERLHSLLRKVKT